MSSLQVCVVAEPDHRPLSEPQNAATTEIASLRSDRGAASGDDAMFKLSRRLWSLEIHRRLALQARRMI